MTQPDPAEPELTDVQKAYNVAQSDMFQLAAYGHHRYHPSGECLTDEGKRQQRDYLDRIRTAREELEAATLRLVAEHAETFHGHRAASVDWLRLLADDPAELSLLAVRPDEREEILEGRPVPAVVSPPTSRPTAPTDWVDGHPQLEAIARAVWEHCQRGGHSTVDDDPRNIAVAALAAMLTDPPSQADEAQEQPTEVPCVRPDVHPPHLHSGLRKGSVVHGRCPGVAHQQPTREV